MMSKTAGRSVMNISALLGDAGIEALRTGFHSPHLMHVLMAFCDHPIGRSEIERLGGHPIKISIDANNAINRMAEFGRRPDQDEEDQAFMAFVNHLKSRTMDDECVEWPDITMPTSDILSSIIRSSSVCAVTKSNLLAGELHKIVALEMEEEGYSEDCFDLEQGVWDQDNAIGDLDPLAGSIRSLARNESADMARMQSVRPSVKAFRRTDVKKDPQVETTGRETGSALGDDVMRSLLEPEQDAPQAEKPEENDPFADQSPDFSGPAAPAARSSRDKKAEDGHEEAVIRCLRDLSGEASRGELDSVVGRQVEIDHVLSIMRRRRKSSVILSGDAGVGKTAIAEGVAIALRDPDVDKKLSRRPVYSLSLTDLVAGTKLRGDFETRMSILVRIATEKNAILFIDEIHNLIGAGASYGRNMDGANLLKPALARGQISVIGATTSEEVRILRTDAALMRRFDVLIVKETSPEKTLGILQRSAWSYEMHHEVSSASGTYEAIIDICSSSMPARKFPDKAFDLLDMACVVARENVEDTVTVSHVRTAAQRLGVRVPRILGGAEIDAISKLEKNVAGSALAPADAEKLSQAVHMAKSGFSRHGCSGFAIFTQNGSESDSIMLGGLMRALEAATDWPIVCIDVSRITDKALLPQLIGHGMRSSMTDMAGDLVAAGDSNNRFILHITGLETADFSVQQIIKTTISTGALTAGDGRIISFSGAYIVASLRVDDTAAGMGFSTSLHDEAGFDHVKRILDTDLVDMASPIAPVASPAAMTRDVYDEIAERAIAMCQAQMSLGGMAVVIDAEHLDDVVAYFAGVLRAESDRSGFMTVSRTILQAVTSHNAPGTMTSIRVYEDELIAF